jgi:Uma2 family endonuclease
MSTTTLTTVEQFEQLPQEDGVRYELKDGELVRMANAKAGHEQTKSLILFALIPYVLENPIGRVYAEASFALSSSRVCVPDVSFLRIELASRADPDHIFQGPPDLAIEVVSESESALDLREKIEDYLNAGSRAVWAFYPKVRVIDVYDASGVHEVRDDQILEAPEILPGFHARAGQFFEY